MDGGRIGIDDNSLFIQGHKIGHMLEKIKVFLFGGTPIKGEPMKRETYFKTVNVNTFMTFNQWSDEIYLKTIRAKQFEHISSDD